jgi:serine/threonine-protein kinase
MASDQASKGFPESGSAPTPDAERAVFDIVDAALDAPEAERSALIAERAKGNEALRRAVDRLLATMVDAERDPQFLDAPAADYVLPIITDMAAYDRLADERVATELSSALGDRYTIEREIARGGMSTVYLARDERHNRQVAIKVMHAERTHDAGVQRFLREIAIVSMVRHPHILPLYDSGEVNGHLFYVMPYVEGGSLAQEIERVRQLPVERALGIARDIAEALDYAHSCGVVHRDIKPPNILLDRDHAVVADFGVARAIAVASSDRVTETGIAVGTAGYMSPEQAEGETALDARSDVYALGCVVYEMLAGEPPFTGASRQVILAKHALGSVPEVRKLRPAIGSAVQPVLERALAKLPADRYASAGEFVRALDAASTATAPSMARRAAVIAGGVVLVGASATILLRSGPAVAPASSPAAMAPPPARALDPKRIAVLYLDDLSPGGTLGHVAAGLTEDLIDELSQVRGLRVISPNGVRPFVKSPPTVDSIARQLDVGTLIAGSVNTSGQRLQVKVRLITAPRGDQVVSRTLNYGVEDLLTLEEKLSEEVSLLLRSSLGQEVRLQRLRAEAKSVTAWEAAHRADELARDGWNLVLTNDPPRAAAVLLRADSLYGIAERADPRWIVPTIGRGWMAANLAIVAPNGPRAAGDSANRVSISLRGDLSAGWLARSVEHAERALTTSPGDGEALALRGYARYRLATYTAQPNADSILRIAETDLTAGVTQRPDLARAWFTLAELFYRSSRFSEATRAARTAIETDAFLTEMPSALNILFPSAVIQEQFADAGHWCDLATKRYPNDMRFFECRLMLLGSSGRGPDDVASAWRAVRDVERRDSVGALAGNWANRRFLVAAVLARSGLRDSARAVLRRTHAEEVAHPASMDRPQTEAYVLTLLGDWDGAIRLIRRYVETGPVARRYAAVTPWFRPLRTDPRFQQLTAGR